MKKFMSFMLALAMVFACLPMYGAATEEVATASTTVEQTITFDNTSKRTECTTSVQVWEENGIKVTNGKGTGSNINGTYFNPLRLYANANLVIECPNMAQIVFNANSASYATALKNSITTDTNYTFTVNSKVVTVTFTEPVDSFSIAKFTAQTRVDSITVTTLIDDSASETSAEVSFDLNYEGATGAPETTTITVGEAYGTLPPAEREGFEFGGWYTNKDCTGDAVTPETKVYNTHILYAQWLVSVNFDLKYDGDALDAIKPMAGGTYASLPVVSRDGYLFGGWFTTPDCEGEAVTNNTVVTASHTLYAKWTEVDESKLTEIAIDFSTTAQRTNFSDTQQVWKNGALTFTNDKATSANNVANYPNDQYAHVRLYKNSSVTIACEDMTQIVIVSEGGADYKNALTNSLKAAEANYTTSENTYTIVFGGLADTFTLSLSGGQCRFKSITVTAIGSTTEEDASTVVKGCEMTLKDEMIVNFTMDISEAIKNDANAYVQVNIGEYSYSVPIAQVGEKLQVPIDATQMSDEITIVIEGNGESIVSDVFTVSHYCQAILNNPEHEAYYPLVREMLNYGRAAQIHFNGSSEITVDGAGQEDVPAEGGEIGLEDQIENIDCIGASLVYRDKIAVRYYFKGDLTGCTFAVNGAVTELQVGSDNYVEVADIMPQDLDKQVVLTVTDTQGNAITVTYCPMNYIVRMSQKGQDTTKALVKALYNYHLAAKAFSGS